MKRALCVALVALAVDAMASARFVDALKEGRNQTIVCYGTSLTVQSSEWVGGLRSALEARWPGKATVINSGLSGKNSATGLANVQDKVVSKNPDAVLIEFSMNDAADSLNTGKTAAQALADAESNLKAIIAAVTNANPSCAIIDCNAKEAADAYWEVEKGLADAKGVSFRHMGHPNSYLAIDADGFCNVIEDDGSADFAKRATWYDRSGHELESLHSFESAAKPGEFLRTRGRLKVEGRESSGFRLDSTFELL